MKKVINEVYCKANPQKSFCLIGPSHGLKFLCIIAIFWILFLGSHGTTLLPKRPLQPCLPNRKIHFYYVAVCLPSRAWFLGHRLLKFRVKETERPSMWGIHNKDRYKQGTIGNDLVLRQEEKGQRKGEQVLKITISSYFCYLLVFFIANEAVC